MKQLAKKKMLVCILYDYVNRNNNNLDKDND